MITICDLERKRELFWGGMGSGQIVNAAFTIKQDLILRSKFSTTKRSYFTPLLRHISPELKKNCPKKCGETKEGSPKSSSKSSPKKP